MAKRLMTSIGRYIIDGELGKGGMGSVLLAHDPSLKRQVAIKCIRTDSETDSGTRTALHARLLREAEAAARLNHPGIVAIYDLIHEADSSAYIVMEYVQGRTLADLLAPGKAADPEYALRIMRELAAALDHAHLRKIIHRDIKPANIMIDQSGVARITDFGIAKIVGGTANTEAGVTVGTLAYMSPEQVSGKELDGRSDQFSLALVAYNLFTGTRVYDSQTLRTMIVKIMTQPPPRASSVNSALPAAVDQVLDRALSKQPEDRFTTCTEFVAALAQAFHPSSAFITAAPTPASSASLPATRPAPAMQSRRFPIWGAVGAACIVVIASIFLLLRSHLGDKQSANPQIPHSKPHQVAQTDTGMKEPIATSSQPPIQPPVTGSNPGSAVAVDPPSHRQNPPAKNPPVAVTSSHEDDDDTANQPPTQPHPTHPPSSSGPDAQTGWRSGKALYEQKDYSAAFPLIEKAALAGISDAENYLGRMYQAGWGTKQDYVLARTWFRKAAAAGNLEAENDLGKLYERGQGGDENYPEALNSFRRAAEGGNSNAMANLGLLYEHARGVPQDYDEAMKWFRQAADAGNSHGMNSVGVLYEHGWGVPKDRVEAIRWFQRSADAGYDQAQQNLDRLQAKHLGHSVK